MFLKENHVVLFNWLDSMPLHSLKSETKRKKIYRNERVPNQIEFQNPSLTPQQQPKLLPKWGIRCWSIKNRNKNLNLWNRALGFCAPVKHQTPSPSSLITITTITSILLYLLVESWEFYSKFKFQIRQNIKAKKQIATKAVYPHKLFSEKLLV